MASQPSSPDSIMFKGRNAPMGSMRTPIQPRKAPETPEHPRKAVSFSRVYDKDPPPPEEDAADDSASNAADDEHSSDSDHPVHSPTPKSGFTPKSVLKNGKEKEVQRSKSWCQPIHAFVQGTSDDGSVFNDGEFSLRTFSTPERERREEEAAFESLNMSPARRDAQSMGPPNACIFVGNLSQAIADVRLQAEVTRVFSNFGVVFVKMKRDRAKMPFAFCQFTNEEDAIRAEKEGKGLDILGRPCRTEFAGGNGEPYLIVLPHHTYTDNVVHFIVFKKSEEKVHFREALALLQPYGNIAKIEEVDNKVRERLGLPQCLQVSYSLFDAKRDVVKAYKNHPQYMVIAHDPRKDGEEEPAVHPQPARKLSCLDQFDKDRRSVFFGSLPAWADKDYIYSLVERFGPVVEIQLKTSYAASSKFTPLVPAVLTAYIHQDSVFKFAFVEFERVSAPDEAAKSLNGYFPTHATCAIRVERKKPRVPATPQREYGYDYGGSSSRNYVSSSYSNKSSSFKPSSAMAGESRALVPVTPDRDYSAARSSGPSFADRMSVQSKRSVAEQAADRAAHHARRRAVVKLPSPTRLSFSLPPEKEERAVQVRRPEVYEAAPPVGTVVQAPEQAARNTLSTHAQYQPQQAAMQHQSQPAVPCQPQPSVQAMAMPPPPPPGQYMPTGMGPFPSQQGIPGMAPMQSMPQIPPMQGMPPMPSVHAVQPVQQMQMAPFGHFQFPSLNPYMPAGVINYPPGLYQVQNGFGHTYSNISGPPPMTGLPIETPTRTGGNIGQRPAYNAGQRAEQKDDEGSN
ncbi:hypothetical protein G7046_g237 [Stylonectria norvegica]|nr:hypothetical protein G7046_g237 [Stylonectria norvegica]